MTITAFQSINEELQQAQRKVQSKLIIKAGSIGDFARLNVSPVNRVIRPALVIMTSHLYNNRSEQVIHLAAILQFIYLASQIHRGINEDFPPGEKHDPRDGCQFPVLVGDYLFGRFFTTLCDAGIINYLHPLAKIISNINEGGILDRLHPAACSTDTHMHIQIVRLETAEMMAGCCRLAADLAAAGEERCHLMHQFGLNIGMAAGLLEQGADTDTVSSYLDKAEDYLSSLPEAARAVELREVLYLFRQREVILRRLVG